MNMTKKIYLIIVLLISITYCNAQCKELYETESMETIVSSRKKGSSVKCVDGYHVMHIVLM